MATTDFRGDLHVIGGLDCTGTFDVPDGSLRSEMWSSSSGDALAATKVIARRCVSVELFGPATTVAALTKGLHIVRGATGTLIGFEAVVHGTIASGADRTLSVDLHKSTGGGAFATVLSGLATITDADTVRTPYAATLSSASLVDGDILEAIVTVGGSSGDQALGLLITLTFDEDPA